MPAARWGRGADDARRSICSERLLVPHALDGRRRDGALDRDRRARRDRRPPLRHDALAALLDRSPAPQPRAADDRVPGAPHPHLGARQLRPDRAARRGDSVRRFLPAVLAGARRGLLRSAARCDDHEPRAQARRASCLARRALALLCLLAGGPAARLRHGQRRQGRVVDGPQHRLPGGGRDQRDRAGRLRAARGPAGARRRAGEHRGLRAVPRRVASRRATRLGMGAPLGNAELAAGQGEGPEVGPKGFAVTEATGAPGLPRLLAGVEHERPVALATHLSIHGPLPVLGRPQRGRPGELVDEIERAGLHGRGGAGFPTALKLHAVAAARGRGRTVVVNATEGEPASAKDETLLCTAPHLVLDGAVAAARAVSAGTVILCIGEDDSPALQAARQAIAERRGLPAEVSLSLRAVPDGYVAGQESALVCYLNGAAAKPTFTPPMIFERGVAGRPTLLSNAETFAHVALIARHGAAWFRSLGTPAHPGSMLVTLGGPVAYPGVYEIEHGATLRSLIDAAGGRLGPVRAGVGGRYPGPLEGPTRGGGR